MRRKCKLNYRRTVLRLPDLDHSKLAVLNSLSSPASRRVYEYAIDQFIAWYCSEPRLAFNRIVVTRYRMHLESRGLAANTINQQLAAVRRLAHEAADSGLLSPELAAGIGRVKGAKQLGLRSGNWLTVEQCSEVLKQAAGHSLRAKRDYAMLAMLFGCGLRRSELVSLQRDEVQMRQGHWAIVDLIGKGGHIRTVPIPAWVKDALDDWAAQAGIRHGRIFRAVSRMGKVWGKGVSQNVVWYVVKTCCERAGLLRIAPHDLRRTCAKLCHSSGGELEQIQFLLEHASVQTTERYPGCKQNLAHPVNDLFHLGADPISNEPSAQPGALRSLETSNSGGLECPDRGSDYADAISCCSPEQFSPPERADMVQVRTGDRPEGIRPCSESGIGGGYPADEAGGGSDQAGLSALGVGGVSNSAPERDQSQVRVSRFEAHIRARNAAPRRTHH
jgi:site-specific recombinase XerD